MNAETLIVIELVLLRALLAVPLLALVAGELRFRPRR